MRTLRTKQIFRLGVAVIALAGSVAALVGRSDLALVAVLILLAGGLALLELVYRRLGLVRRSQSRELSTLRGVKARVDRLPSRRSARTVTRLARRAVRRAEAITALVREVERRQLGSFEAERLRAAERHRELPALVAEAVAEYLRANEGEIAAAVSRKVEGAAVTKDG